MNRRLKGVRFIGCPSSLTFSSMTDSAIPSVAPRLSCRPLDVAIYGLAANERAPDLKILMGAKYSSTREQAIVCAYGLDTSTFCDPPLLLHSNVPSSVISTLQSAHTDRMYYYIFKYFVYKSCPEPIDDVIITSSSALAYLARKTIELDTHPSASFPSAAPPAAPPPFSAVFSFLSLDAQPPILFRSIAQTLGLDWTERSLYISSCDCIYVHARGTRIDLI